jgi:hypothetical protein
VQQRRDGRKTSLNGRNHGSNLTQQLSGETKKTTTTIIKQLKEENLGGVLFGGVLEGDARCSRGERARFGPGGGGARRQHRRTRDGRNERGGRQLVGGFCGGERLVLGHGRHLALFGQRRVQHAVHQIKGIERRHLAAQHLQLAHSAHQRRVRLPKKS